MSKNESARILTVGRRLMKSAIAREKKNMTIIASTTAEIITAICCASPMAVTMLSKEKTVSTKTSWLTIAPNDVPAPLGVAPPSCGSPSSFSWISRTVLYKRNKPPASIMRLRMLKPYPATLNSSRLPLVTSQPSPSKSALRIRMPAIIQTRRASSWRFSGSRPIRIETKITLSMPSTISNTISVNRLMRESKLQSACMGGQLAHKNRGWDRMWKTAKSRVLLLDFDGRFTHWLWHWKSTMVIENYTVPPYHLTRVYKSGTFLHTWIPMHFKETPIGSVQMFIQISIEY